MRRAMRIILAALVVLLPVRTVQAAGSIYTHGLPMGAQMFLWRLAVVLGAAAVLVVLGALCTLAVLLVRRRKGHARRGLPLDRYLRQWGGRLPSEMALHLLGPVADTLATLHVQGATHLQVCPARITVDTHNRACLQPPVRSGEPPLQPGFCAPEQYLDADGAGPWTDTYALAAVLAYTITGVIPAVPRPGEAVDPALVQRLHSAGTPPGMLAALQSALDPQPQLRPQSAADLLQAMGARRPPVTAAAQTHGRRRPVGLRGRLIIAAAGMALLACLALVVWVGSYNTAMGHVYTGRYDQAVQALTVVPDFFHDTRSLRDYCNAGILLQQGDYEAAIDAFGRLEGYSNSAELLREALYAQAQADLQAGNFAYARAAFLSLGEYKDARAMLDQTDLRRARALLAAGELDAAAPLITALCNRQCPGSDTLAQQLRYLQALRLQADHQHAQALALFQDLGDYADSAEQAAALIDHLYTKALQHYKKGQYLAARQALEPLPATQSVQDYLVLIQAHQAGEHTDDGNIAAKRRLFTQLLAMGDFADAPQLCHSDAFIEFALEGHWVGSGHTLLVVSSDTGQWSLTYTLPHGEGAYYKIENRVLMLGDDTAGWQQQFAFTIDAPDKLRVYCYRNGRTYVLRRQ